MTFLEAFTKSLLGGGAVKDDSKTGELFNTKDLAKTAIHALVVGGSAALVILVQWGTSQNWGEYNAVVIPIISTLSTYLTKVLKDNDPVGN